MTKANACFNVGGISGKHDVKDIKRGLDTLPGVLSVTVSNESRVSVDFDTGVITDATTGKTYQAEPFPDFIQKIMKAGGLLASLKEV